MDLFAILRRNSYTVFTKHSANCLRVDTQQTLMLQFEGMRDAPITESRKQHHELHAHDHEKIGAARVSILSNTVLVVLKLVVGIISGSVSVLSEAVHSASDLLAAFIAFFAVRAASAPPDKDHPFGHGKMESLSGLLEALLIIGAAGFIVFEALHALQRNELTIPGWLPITVMVISTVVNFFVVRYLFDVAGRTDSPALAADARHLSVDIWTSLGVLVGLLLARWTGLAWLDPAIALVVSVFVFITAFRIVRDAVAPLSDAVLPENEVSLIEGIFEEDPRVLDWHKLRTRKSGSSRHVDVHIHVEDDMSLRDAHELTEQIEDKIRAALPNVHIVIHTEPFEEERAHHRDNPH